MSEAPYEHTLKMLAEARKDETVLKATLRQELWDEYNKRLTLARYRTSRLANEAKAQGASIAAIGRACNTSNWNTVKALIGLLEDEFTKDAEVAATLAPPTPTVPWEYDEESLVLTLHGYVDRLTQKQIDEDLLVQLEYSIDGKSLRSADSSAADPEYLGTIIMGMNIASGALIVPGSVPINPGIEEDALLAELWAQGEATEKDDDW